MTTFDTENEARKACNWLNSYLDEQETGVQVEIVEKDGKYIIAVSQL